MTETEKWCYEDAVIFDLPVEEILINLIHEGHSVDNAIKIIEETQNITIKL